MEFFRENGRKFVSSVAIDGTKISRVREDFHALFY